MPREPCPVALSSLHVGQPRRQSCKRGYPNEIGFGVYDIHAAKLPPASVVHAWRNWSRMRAVRHDAHDDCLEVALETLSGSRDHINEASWQSIGSPIPCMVLAVPAARREVHGRIEIRYLQVWTDSSYKFAIVARGLSSKAEPPGCFPGRLLVVTECVPFAALDPRDPSRWGSWAAGREGRPRRYLTMPRPARPPGTIPGG